MPKRIPLQKSKQLFGWNSDDQIKEFDWLKLDNKVCKFNKEDWLQIYD